MYYSIQLFEFDFLKSTPHAMNNKKFDKHIYG